MYFYRLYNVKSKDQIDIPMNIEAPRTYVFDLSREIRVALSFSALFSKLLQSV